MLAKLNLLQFSSLASWYRRRRSNVSLPVFAALEDPSSNCCDCVKNKCKDLSRNSGLGVSLLLSLLVNAGFVIRCLINHRIYLLTRLRRRLFRVNSEVPPA